MSPIFSAPHKQPDVYHLDCGGSVVGEHINTAQYLTVAIVEKILLALQKKIFPLMNVMNCLFKISIGATYFQILSK